MNETSENRPGPKPDRLKLPYDDWEEAVREALEEEKPEEDWPEDDVNADQKDPTDR